MKEVCAVGEADKRIFTDAFRQQIEIEHGNRGRKALEIVREQRVKRYKDYYIVVGETDEYVVEGAFCTCKDFLFNASRSDIKCSHVIAVEIAEQKGIVDVIDAWYQDVRPLP